MTANDSKSTPKKAERHPLALLESLLGSAESAAAARLEQMHGHLNTNHRASGYDGTAAQIHAQYAQALAPIVQALRAQAEAEAGLRVAAEAVLSEFHANRLRPVFVVGEPHRAWKTRVIVDRLASALAQAGGES